MPKPLPARPGESRDQVKRNKAGFARHFILTLGPGFRRGERN